ncbi:ArdC family protein [Frankia sp. B2]|uniref:ArdC family protein n=1 Tax=Frankia sp. B2 TaxID=2541730 RepID=UPI00197AE0F1|nr:zincin-like metallopeptidase domain-containing protein [Frankia sp. B2]
MTRQNVYEIVTDTVINALENGTVPWHQPWNVEVGVPLSLATGKPYRGVNPFLLGLTALTNGYRSPWWGTLKKINERGGTVRKGEHSTLVVFWKSYLHKATADDEKDERRFLLRYYRVFNADQADWDEGKEPTYAALNRPDVERIATAEAIADGYQDSPSIRTGEAAYYESGAVDRVTMPPIDAFDSAEEYYATLFHELTHSTGHENRLDRDGVRTGSFGRFGDPVYSKEELVAEMGAALLCAIAGIDQKALVENSAAYLRSWLGVLREDSKLIVQAAAQAQHAADHILGVSFGEDG